MLIAHLVPGYFNAVASQYHWDQDWTSKQRRILWTVAFASTFLPDIDVIFNITVRGIFNHSTLLTHSLFPVLIFTMAWGVCKYSLRRHYLSTIWALLAMSWLSHVLLDALVHKTPLLYLLSSEMFGYAPLRVYAGGFWYYLTDPIFLLEPLLIMVGVGHWLSQRIIDIKTRRVVLSCFVALYLISATIFILFLPHLQSLLPAIPRAIASD